MSLLGECASSSDHDVIYGINLDFDHELKMQSRPEPGIELSRSVADMHTVLYLGDSNNIAILAIVMIVLL